MANKDRLVGQTSSTGTQSRPPGPGQQTAGAPRPGDQNRDNRPGPPVGLPPSRWEWWKDADVKKELSLSDDKANKIGQITDGRDKQMKPFAEEYLKELNLLNQMTKERTTSLPSYQIQVSKVEALRSRLEESRIVMFYRIYLELTPSQYQKLIEITDRRRQGRGADLASLAGFSLAAPFICRCSRSTNVMKSVLRNATVWAVALGVTAGQALQAQGPTPATPAQSQLPIDRYVVGQARPPELPGQTMKDVSLEEAMAIALENNLELKVARMNPQSVDYQLQGVRASFTPTVAANYSYNNSARLSENTLEGVSRVVSLGQNFNGSMTQNLQWWGSRYTINFQNSRSSNNVVTTSINPSYNSSLRFQFDVPILAGFRIDNTRNQLRTLTVQRQIEDLRLQQTIENTKASVRTVYWNLKAAVEAIEIQRRSLDLAQRTLRDNQVRVEIGTLAPIETAQSETAVAQAEQQLLNAEIVWRNADLAIKRLLAASQDDPIFQSTLNPVERVGVLTETGVDIPDAIKEALGSRLDLVQQRKTVDVQRLNLEVTKDVLKPNLAFSSGYVLAGTAGTRRVNQGGIITTLPAGYWDALTALGSLDTPTWTLGVNLTYPLGMRSAKANYARAALGLDQAEAQLKAQELTISTEVTAAGLDVENTYKQVIAAQKAREAAVRNAEAQQTRFEVGLATNFEVVSAQQTLTSARLSELRAILNYVNSIANFEKIRRVGR